MTIYVRQWGYVKKRFGSRVRGSLYCLDIVGLALWKTHWRCVDKRNLRLNLTSPNLQSSTINLRTEHCRQKKAFARILQKPF